MCDFRSNVYNIDSKKRFIEEIDINKYPPRWWERAFEKSYIFETKKNKDLYSFTTPEILEFYKFLEIKTLTSLVIYNTNLIRYGLWALQNNLIFDGQNHFDEISTEMLNGCVSKVGAFSPLCTKEGFLEFINQMENAQDRFVFMAMFEGIKGKEYSEIIDLKISDINYNNNTVKLSSGRTMKVSEEFISICEKADAQTIYSTLVHETIRADLAERELIPSTRIYKEKVNSRGIDLPRTVYNTILRNINFLGYDNKSLTVKMLRDYGFIYYLNERAKENNMSTVDLLYGDRDLFEDLLEKYYFNYNTKKRFIIEYKDYLYQK